jgi:hypothetical protein
MLYRRVKVDGVCMRVRGKIRGLLRNGKGLLRILRVRSIGSLGKGKLLYGYRFIIVSLKIKIKVILIFMHCYTNYFLYFQHQLTHKIPHNIHLTNSKHLHLSHDLDIIDLILTKPLHIVYF